MRANEVAYRGFRHRDGEGLAVQGGMREQSIDGAFQIAAIGRYRFGDVSDHFRRDGEAKLLFLHGGDARLENLDPQSFVQLSDVDAEAALEAR